MNEIVRRRGTGSMTGTETEGDMNVRTVAFWTTVTRSETGIGTETDSGRGREWVVNSHLALVSMRSIASCLLLLLPLHLLLLL